MESRSRSRVSAPVPDETHLTELVKEIRAGVPNATVELQRIFYPGACFLIQRRLGRSGVDHEARSVIEAAVRSIRENKSIEGRNLPGLVRQLIVQCFPASHEGSAVVKEGPARPAAAVAKRILGTMSPVERDALRRCYVLGQSPETFLNTLKLTADQFRSIRLRARDQFSTGTPKQINVA